MGLKYSLGWFEAPFNLNCLQLLEGCASPAPIWWLAIEMVGHDVVINYVNCESWCILNSWSKPMKSHLMNNYTHNTKSFYQETRSKSSKMNFKSHKILCIDWIWLKFKHSWFWLATEVFSATAKHFPDLCGMGKRLGLCPTPPAARDSDPRTSVTSLLRHCYSCASYS